MCMYDVGAHILSCAFGDLKTTSLNLFSPLSFLWMMTKVTLESLDRYLYPQNHLAGHHLSNFIMTSFSFLHYLLGYTFDIGLRFRIIIS